jgi:hypothetical protein
MYERSVEQQPTHSQASERTRPAKSVQSPRHSGLAQLAQDITASTRMAEQRSQLIQHKSKPVPGGMPVPRPGKKEKVPLQGRFAAAQLQAKPKKKTVQKKTSGQYAALVPETLVQMRVEPANRTGLPNQLKTGIESLSGYSMDDVKVHYNSSKPAQLQALAYAQGTDIHLGPGQEKHLPHEAWHVVQQKQGRVKATMQAKGVSINDDHALEREADVMGTRACQLKAASTPRKRKNGGAGQTAQMAWAARPYNVSGGQRSMEVDTRAVVWGGTGGAANYAHHPDRGRAILFETMCRDTGVGAIMARLSQPASLWDTGLTIVINRAWTPDKIYDGAGQQTAANRTQGQSKQQALQALDAAYQQAVNAWNGIPVHIVTAAWERREVDRGEGPALEQVQGSVPYSTFRVLAGTNGAAIDAALRANHEQVWHKMGDDDMPYVNPNNAASPEMQKLGEVEQAGQIYAKNTLVTFGYDLITAGTQPPITAILSAIYAKEMALRDKIAELGAPMYPSEPTTFYRPRGAGSMDAPWHAMEGQHVGGSGQQLEGAKLVKAMSAGDGGLGHYTFHTVRVQTGAGARNDALVALLDGWLQAQDPWRVKADEIEARINELDQSALRHNEYLNKVVANLGGQLDEHQFGAIRQLVESYRKEAAAEAARTLQAEIRSRLFQASWQSSLNARWAKYGL